MRCAPRFAELAGQTMTMREICDSNATGMRRGHEAEEDFCHSGSYSRAVSQRAKEPVELTCHSQCWRLYNRTLLSLFHLLSLLFPRATAVPHSVSSLSLTLSPLVLHPSSRLSWLLRCTDVAIQLRARETRVCDVASHLRQRIRQRVVFALCVTLRLWHPDSGVGIVGSLSLSLSFSPTRSPPLSLFPSLSLSPISLSLSLSLCRSVVGPSPALIPDRQCSQQRHRNVRSVYDNALSPGDASRGLVNMV